MKIIPLAFESMGVRSSAILVEKNDLRIVIDPAVALAPNRFGLSPHSLEKEAKDVLWSKVKQEVEKTDIIVITHYHFDHFDPKEPDIYEQKRVLLKNPRRMINPSQKTRASSFIKSIKKIADEIYYVDNKTVMILLTACPMVRRSPTRNNMYICTNNIINFAGIESASW